MKITDNVDCRVNNIATRLPYLDQQDYLLDSLPLQRLHNTLRARDIITEEHSERLEGLVKSMGQELNLSIKLLYNLRLLAKFHDIGKIWIPDNVLLKPGKLSEDERLVMQRHSEIGYQIAQSLPELKPIAELILKHHEHWNGKGYLLQLNGKEIPLECRILAIADAYDAMTNDRPYRKAMSHAEAMAELQRCSGTQFDPDLVLLFRFIF